MSRLLIIDTYGLIFRAYHAYPMLTTADGKPTNAVFGFLQMLLTSIEKFNPNYIVCSLESETLTFRHNLDSAYKANRKEAEEELKLQIGDIINVIARLNIKTLQLNGYEADDVIGSYATQNQDNFDTIEIITGDRDLLQLLSPKIKIFIPGKYFSDLIEYDRHKFKEKFDIEIEDYVLYKSLAGDSSDNIKGIPGIGPKGAAKIVNQFHSINSLLANLDQLPPRLAEAISENQNLLKKYYDLSKIECDIPLNISKEDLKVSKINVTELRKIVDEYEFKSMSKKIAKFIDNFEKKYGGFSLFDFEDEKEKKNELTFSIVDKVKFEDNAYLIKSINAWKIGNGKEFVEISKSDLYNFIILNKINNFIGFDIKEFIRDLISSGITHIYDYEFFDIKLAWHLIKNYLSFENINELCTSLKTDSYLEIYNKTNENLINSGSDKLFEIEKKLEIVLAEMEYKGIYCDLEYLKTLEKDYREKIENTKKEIFNFVGHEFNPASTRELGHILFEVLKLPVFKKNKTGYSTDDRTLSKLEGMSEIIPLIKNFRYYSKILSTYVIGLQNAFSQDEKIHTTFVQDQVATGRLSSINPNLQNLPADEQTGIQIRAAFKSKGGLFLSLDYSQIDLRILAYESKDEKLTEAFENNDDIHEATAKVIFEKDQISKDERRFAKTINFGIVYGMEPYGLSQALKISQNQAKEFIDKYFEKFAGVKKYFDRITNQLDEKGYVNTFLGRKRYFPTWKQSSGFQKKMLFREAINMPVQGGSSEIIKLAMIQIVDLIRKENIEADLLLQIHDELIFEIRNEDAISEIEQKFKSIMENVYDLGIPLQVSSKIGKDLSFD